MTLNAGEQYLLELINRARIDPVAEAARYNLGLNDGLKAGTIDSSAKQVLAPNAKLEDAAIDHSAWMLANNTFSHTGAGDTNAGARMGQSGYEFTGSWAWRENLAWVGSTGNVDMQAAILEHHEGLYRSESHRVNTFAEGMQEIGIGQVAGKYSYNGTTYNSSMLTQKFAYSGNEIFVTGVAYRDGDKDGFYSIGEGQKGVWFKVGGVMDTSTAAGGYAVDAATQDEVRVLVGKGGALMAKVDLDTSDGNVKLDLVTQANGGRVLDVSTNAELVWGVGNAQLLGSDNLDLTGHAGANQLTGNSGNNHLYGGGGNDDLRGMNGFDFIDGGAGHDKIFGGNGHDRLLGRQGNDTLSGGNGNDKMFGDAGTDTLKGGFGNDVLWGGAGNDKLIGENGFDILLGNGGRDFMYGGYGNDRFDGGAGSDVMTGGGGADMFIFSAHRDVITDFQDNVDTIAIRNYLGDGDLSVAEVLDIGEIRNGNAIFDFGKNHILTIVDVGNLDILANDMIII